VIWNVPLPAHGPWIRSVPRSWGMATCRLLALLAMAAASPAEESYEIYYQHRLENETDQPLTNVRVYIPIPQDSPHQAVRDFTIELWGQPFETVTRRDKFGQLIAQITIPAFPPGAEIEVGFSCEVELHPVERIELRREQAGTLSDIPPEISSTYTANVRSIYDLDDPAIQREAGRLAKLHPNLVDRVLAIHDFVAGGLVYQRGGGWDAAPKVLRRKNGSCSEFTFLFCALCRAAGLPTRLVGSSRCRQEVAPTYHDTVCHRWAEVYLPPYGWVPFDTTADRGKPPKRKYAGAHYHRALIVSKVGGGGTLGKQYIGANSHYKQLKRQRGFTWSRGARDAYARAEQACRQEDYEKAMEAMAQVVERFAGSKWAKSAEGKLEMMRADPAVTAAIHGVQTARQCKSWLEMARSLAKDGNYAAARKYYQRVIETCPDAEYASVARDESAKLPR
jgi:transglutaminase-like putative cysteine protease